MSILDCKIEELEMVAPSLRLVQLYVNPDGNGGVVVASNKSDGEFGAIWINKDGYPGMGNRECTKVIRKKKKKVVYIKTIKELIDSGWNILPGHTFLHHGDCLTTIPSNLFCCLGMLRDEELTSGFTWPPEALIEKDEQ